MPHFHYTIMLSRFNIILFPNMTQWPIQCMIKLLFKVKILPTHMHSIKSQRWNQWCASWQTTGHDRATVGEVCMREVELIIFESFINQRCGLVAWLSTSFRGLIFDEDNNIVKAVTEIEFLFAYAHVFTLNFMDCCCCCAI